MDRLQILVEIYERLSELILFCSLEMSQNSQENTCARVSFIIKLQVLGLQLYQKSDFRRGDFL